MPGSCGSIRRALPDDREPGAGRRQAVGSVAVRISDQGRMRDDVTEEARRGGSTSMGGLSDRNVSRPVPVAPVFCWACGNAVGPAIGPPCPVCGTGRDLPVWEPDSLVGCTVEYRHKLNRRFGLVLDEGSDAVTVQHERSELIVPRSRIRDVTPNPIPSPAYRLHRVRQPCSPVMGLLGERRAFAACAVAAGDVAGIGASGLGPREQAWLRMWTHHGVGSLDHALTEAIGLGVELYPDRLGIFVATIDLWVGRDEVRSLVFEFCAGRPDDPLAQVLFAVIAEPMPDVAHLVGAAVSAGAPGVSAGVDALHRAGRLEQGNLVAAAAGSRFVHELSLRTLALQSATPGTGVPSLTGIDMAIVDDAIDRGVLTRQHLGSAASALDVGARRYLAARLDPGSLSDDELAVLGHTEEIQRRAFVDGLAIAPAESSGGRFELLERLRRGDQRVLGELVPSLPPDHAAVAIAVGSSLHTGQVEPLAVADPSTWDVLAPVLARLATEHPVGLPPEVRDAAGWALLDVAKRELFDWRWPHAVHAAATCMSVVDDEPRCDEATAIKAAAAFMEGRRDLAVQYLVDAAEGEASDSLLVNLALLWADTEPLRAAGALIRLAAQTADERLKAHASIRAARLCLMEDESWTPSKKLLKLLRRACVADLDLPGHLEAMRLVRIFNPDWVANGKHTDRSAHARTIEHRLEVARADDFGAVLDVLEQAAGDPASADVVRRETEDVVRGVFAAIASSEDPVPSAAFAGLDLFDRGLPVDQYVAVALRTRCVQEMCWFVGMSDERLFPLESLHGHLDDAARSIRDLDADLQDEAQEQVDEARVTLGQTWCGCWAREHDSIVEAFNELVESYNDRLSRASSHFEVERVNQVWRQALSSVRADVAALLQNASEHSREIPRLDGVRDRYDDLIRSMHELDDFLVEAGR